jgi:hypothetical protein
MGQEIDRVMDEITPAASLSCPLCVLLGDLIKWMLRLFCLLPLGGWPRLG